MLKVIKLVFLLFLISCSGIKTLNIVDRNKLYGPDFLHTVRKINELLDQKEARSRSKIWSKQNDKTERHQARCCSDLENRHEATSEGETSKSRQRSAFKIKSKEWSYRGGDRSDIRKIDGIPDPKT